jgi:hypothetical protein
VDERFNLGSNKLLVFPIGNNHEEINGKSKIVKELGSKKNGEKSTRLTGCRITQCAPKYIFWSEETEGID